MADPEAERYIVAIKRDVASSLDDEWISRITAIDGLDLLGHLGRRAQVDATPDAAAELKELFGDEIHVERAIAHETSQPDSSPQP